MIHDLIMPDGTKVKLGNRVPTAAKPMRFATIGDGGTNTKLIPRSQWDGLLAAYNPDWKHPSLPRKKNQNGVGQCNPTAGALAMEHRRKMQGLPDVSLSPADLYARINGGHDDGSLLEDALAELTTNGIGTTATCGDLWKQGDFKGQASAQERTRFRADEIFHCPTFDHQFSAALEGFSLVTGIPWYDNYFPDADGWLPPPQGNYGGHAIFGYKPTVRRKQYAIWHMQTWGYSYAPQSDGNFAIPESHYTATIGGLYAIRSVTDEGA